MVGPKTELEAKFRARYPSETPPRFFRAPGRINLIGDHTDYNDGLVMPMAIESACYVAVADNGLDRFRVYSEDVQDSVEIRIDDLDSAKPRKNWTDYIVGVAAELKRAGVPLQGRDLLIESTIPIGAGLSSSAALEVASTLALLGKARMEPFEVVQLCQRNRQQGPFVSFGQQAKRLDVTKPHPVHKLRIRHRHGSSYRPL